MILQISVCMLVIALYIGGGRWIDNHYQGTMHFFINAFYLLTLSFAGALVLVSLGY